MVVGMWARLDVIRQSFDWNIVPLGVEYFGQIGHVSKLYHLCGSDADGIVSAAHEITMGRPVRLVG